MRVEAYGVDGFRVRATRGAPIRDDLPGALLTPAPATANHVRISIGPDNATLVNGGLTVRLAPSPEEEKHGMLKSVAITLVRTETGEPLVVERYPLHGDGARAMRSLHTGDGQLFRAAFTFEAHEGEQIYGLGQHQHGYLDQKGLLVPLRQINTEISVPFLLSSRRYGVLWNVPSTGHVSLGRDRTTFAADATRQVDYVVFGGKRLADVMARYVESTGLPPAFPQAFAGYWQCKLRYASQAELLNVTREFQRRGIPLAVAVVDYYHWPAQGDWAFDKTAWPDPRAMGDELRAAGVQLMVSVWPTVEPSSANLDALSSLGLLASTASGMPGLVAIDNQPASHIGGAYVAQLDPFRAEARAFLWEQLASNYVANGVTSFWLDADEGGGLGEGTPLPGADMLYALGSGEEVGNLYPFYHVKAVHDGMRRANLSTLTLSRSAWAGSQRFASAVWSGDTLSTWRSFRQQLAAGLNSAMSGLFWWTTDIGGLCAPRHVASLPCCSHPP